MPRCPTHGIALRQCGHTSITDGAIPNAVWVPMNWWHCVDCKHPDGVFQVFGAKVVKVEV